MRRSVTIRKTSDAGAVSVRSGDKVLGSVAELAATTGETMSGAFSHTPAFADVSMLFLDLERALARGGDGDADAEALHAEIEKRGVHVWHSIHDMRIDQRGSIAISGGRVRFRATDSFVMMRTGGL
jgi:hypothetical protein